MSSRCQTLKLSAPVSDHYLVSIVTGDRPHGPFIYFASLLIHYSPSLPASSAKDPAGNGKTGETKG